jgi:hypothetical protein
MEFSAYSINSFTSFIEIQYDSGFKAVGKFRIRPFFFFMAKQPVLRQGLLIIEASHVLVNNKAKLHITKITIGDFVSYYIAGRHAVAQLVKALRYKPEGCGFDFRRCHWNFLLT